jgi:roadblock/LC7 domain-containing protein
LRASENASGVAVAVFSAKICSAASISFSLVSKDFSLVGSEGPASVSAWRYVALTSGAVVSICVFGASAIFLEVELEDFIVSSTSRTLTILFSFGGHC